MAILLTGGTGKTSTRLARLLQDAKIPFLLASRKSEAEAPSGMPATRFDWLDSSTFENPFQHKFPNGESISAIYLISPEVPDPAPSMTAFIDLAVKKHGVKRFVLLTGSSAEKGGHHVGKVWQYLVDIGVEYCVFRATWFMGAFYHTLQISSNIFPLMGREQKISHSGSTWPQSETRARYIRRVGTAKSRLLVLGILQPSHFARSLMISHITPIIGFLGLSC